MLFRQPGQALGALYWYARGRKVRARNRLRLTTPQTQGAYAVWIATVERQEDAELTASRWGASEGDSPLFSILLHGLSAAAIAQVLSNLEQQVHSEWELIVVASHDDFGRSIEHASYRNHARLRVAARSTDNAAQALTIGLAEARGEFVLPLPQGAALPPTALLRYAQAIDAHPAADLFYGDHDHIDDDGKRTDPWFKPRWNAEMFLAQDYLSQACIIRTQTARAALPIALDLSGAAVYALLLEATTVGEPVRIPHFQAHLPARPVRVERDDPTARLLAVQRFLAGSGQDPTWPTAEVVPGPFDTVRVRWPLPLSPPLVSVIVPTRDQVKLLRTCIEGVLHHTKYPAIEIIIVDNGSTDPATLTYLRGKADQCHNVRVLKDDRPYNYAQLNNFAATEARGEYLCLLNNDTEVIDPHWLSELIRQATRPHIGAAGAMLLYNDRSIQHAGVVVGLKQAAGHAHRFLRPGKPGYFRYPHVPHYVSAVTAACLVVERRKFDAVGGLDEQHLAIAFNDVDLCLKLQQAGWHNVYVPQAVMIHHESKSRGRDVAPRHVERYRRELAILQQRWATRDYADPLHHPHLDRNNEEFTICIQNDDLSR